MTRLTPGVVLGHPEVQGKWPRDPEQLAVNGIDSGVFINELANIELLPRSLKSLSDGEKKSFGQNPENLHWKAHEQGPSPIREGTYRGTKLALTKAYDLIEQRYLPHIYFHTRISLILSIASCRSWMWPILSL
jgi:hypothetical protein